jgi:Ulp1 family protease
MIFCAMNRLFVLRSRRRNDRGRAGAWGGISSHSHLYWLSMKSLAPFTFPFNKKRKFTNISINNHALTPFIIDSDSDSESKIMSLDKQPMQRRSFEPKPDAHHYSYEVLSTNLIQSFNQTTHNSTDNHDDSILKQCLYVPSIVAAESNSFLATISRLNERAESIIEEHKFSTSLQEEEEQATVLSMLDLMSKLERAHIEPKARQYERRNLAIDRLIMLAKPVEPEVLDVFNWVLQDSCYNWINCMKKVIPLSEDDRALAQSLIESHDNPNRVIADAFNIELKGKHFQCLRHLEWLEDEVINFYFNLLDVRSKSNLNNPNIPQPNRLRCFFQNTFFYEKLLDAKVIEYSAYKFNGNSVVKREFGSYQAAAQALRVDDNTMKLYVEAGPSVVQSNGCSYKYHREYNYKCVERWNKRKKIDLSSYDLVLIPIHVHLNHWTLAVINYQRQRIEYYDSLGNSNVDCCNNLKRYVVDEYKMINPSKPLININEWTIETARGIPHQNNGSDCGMFAIKYADYLSEGLELDFSARDMPYFRQRVAIELKAQRII